MKNIVIIGAGIAEVDLARQLSQNAAFPSKTHRIILIERNAFAFWPIGALRAAVQPGFDNKVMSPLKSIFEKGSQHVLLAGAEVVKLEKDAVILNRPVAPFTGTRIPFERAVLASGEEYPFPSRATSNSIEESKADFQQLQRDIKASKSVLILGGGPVGVEMAGEIRHVYPDKKITLISKSKLLIPQAQSEDLHRLFLTQFEEKNIELLLEDGVSLEKGLQTAKLLPTMHKFKSDKGEIVEADLVISAIGTRPDARLIRDLQSTSQNINGFVKVDKDLYIESKGNLLDKFIAIGDVNDVQGGKTAKNAKGQVPVALATILKDINGGLKDDAPVLQIPDKNIVVPFGPQGGASLLPQGAVGEQMTSAIKGQTLFLPMFQSLYA